jgi:predicted lipoprotein with Yx(FWY)xxD motif
MHLKHSIATAAAVTAVVPAGLLGVGAGASIAHSALDPAGVAATAPTVALRTTKLGKVLVAGRSGRTLYLFAKDTKNHSNCSGQCAQAWPPLLVSARPSAGSGVSHSKLGAIKRGNSHQVTYAGHPLYYFVSDTKAGQTTGEGVQKFYAVAASGKAIK